MGMSAAINFLAARPRVVLPTTGLLSAGGMATAGFLKTDGNPSNDLLGNAAGVLGVVAVGAAMPAAITAVSELMHAAAGGRRIGVFAQMAAGLGVVGLSMTPASLGALYGSDAGRARSQSND